MPFAVSAHDPTRIHPGPIALPLRSPLGMLSPPCPSLALAFASPVQYVRTPRLRDKLVLHACVVSLWLHGFEMDISTLGKDFSLPPRKLVGFFRELGCSYRPTLGA